MTCFKDSVAKTLTSRAPRRIVLKKHAETKPGMTLKQQAAHLLEYASLDPRDYRRKKLGKKVPSSFRDVVNGSFTCSVTPLMTRPTTRPVTKSRAIGTEESESPSRESAYCPKTATSSTRFGHVGKVIGEYSHLKRHMPISSTLRPRTVQETSDPSLNMTFQQKLDALDLIRDKNKQTNLTNLTNLTIGNSESNFAGRTVVFRTEPVSRARQRDIQRDIKAESSQEILIREEKPQMNLSARILKRLRNERMDGSGSSKDSLKLNVNDFPIEIFIKPACLRQLAKKVYIPIKRKALNRSVE